MGNFENGPLADLQKEAQEKDRAHGTQESQGSPKQPAPQGPRPPRQGGGGGRNCLLIGLIGCLVVFLLLVVLVVVAFYAGQSWISGMVDQYTDTEPAQLPQTGLTQEEMDAVTQRAETFGKAIEAGEPAQPLTLTARELNALIQGSGPWRELGGDAHVEISDGQITAQVSIPLDKLGWDMFQGRYLNGSATVTVSFENGRLFVFAEDFSVKGDALPEEFRQQLRAQNFAEDLNEDREFMEAFKGINSIAVKDDVLVVTPKNLASTEEGAPEQSAVDDSSEDTSAEATPQEPETAATP